MSTEDEVLAILQEQGADRRELGRQLRAERDPLDSKLLGERDPDTPALRREASLEARLETLEALTREEPGRAYVSLPGEWGRVLFVVKERDRFIGYEYGGAEIWTRPSGELEYFMAGPLGVQRLSRDGALALLAEALEKGGAA